MNLRVSGSFGRLVSSDGPVDGSNVSVLSGWFLKASIAPGKNMMPLAGTTPIAMSPRSGPPSDVISEVQAPASSVIHARTATRSIVHSR